MSWGSFPAEIAPVGLLGMAVMADDVEEVLSGGEIPPTGAWGVVEGCGGDEENVGSRGGDSRDCVGNRVGSGCGVGMGVSVSSGIARVIVTGPVRSLFSISSSGSRPATLR